MKKFISILSITFFLTLILNNNIHAQGCVAIRSTGAGSTVHKPDATNGWSLNINNRYFKSYKHYVGKDEQYYRIDSGTNVINHQYTLDFALTKDINKYWSVMIDVPVLANSRSSLYEHTNPVTKESTGRHATHSFGVGDIRIAAYRWLLNPSKHSSASAL